MDKLRNQGQNYQSNCNSCHFLMHLYAFITSYIFSNLFLSNENTSQIGMYEMRCVIRCLLGLLSLLSMESESTRHKLYCLRFAIILYQRLIVRTPTNVYFYRSLHSDKGLHFMLSVVFHQRVQSLCWFPNYHL